MVAGENILSGKYTNWAARRPPGKTKTEGEAGDGATARRTASGVFGGGVGVVGDVEEEAGHE